MHLTVNDKDAMYYHVIDKDTGKEIEYVTEANDETGEYTVVVIDEQKTKIEGDLIVTTPVVKNGEILKEKKVGNIKLVKKGEEKQ